MEAYEAYKIYTAVTTHFKSPTYNMLQSGFRTSSTPMSFARRTDAPFFYQAANRYKTQREWLNILLACHLKDKTYITDVLSYPEYGEERTQRIQNLPKIYQNDLRTLLEMSSKLDNIFIQNYDESDPTIIQSILSEEISYESAVILDSVFKWIEKARSTDVLMWPDLKQKLVKYQPVLRYEPYKYIDLTKKVIKSYV